MYQLFVGNPYDLFVAGDVICTTTNGVVKADGKAVMGAGNAKFVRDTFPGIDKTLAIMLQKYGNRAVPLGRFLYQGKPLTIVSFPTKQHWRDASDLSLIQTSAEQLVEMADRFFPNTIYVPIPGCTNGGLKWKDVQKVLTVLDERFVVYSLQATDFQP